MLENGDKKPMYKQQILMSCCHNMNETEGDGPGQFPYILKQDWSNLYEIFDKLFS